MGAHYTPSGPFQSAFHFSTDRGFLGSRPHRQSTHRVGTDQEGSSLHGRWWCRQVAARVGLCLEGLSMIMTRPGPLALSSVQCLTPARPQGRHKRICDAVWLCGLVFVAVRVMWYDVSLVKPPLPMKRSADSFADTPDGALIAACELFDTPVTPMDPQHYYLYRSTTCI